MKKSILFSLVASSMLFIACSDDEGNSVAEELVAPDTYSFVRKGETSINFDGQIIRNKMATELFSALKDNSNTDVAALLSMYNHELDGDDFSDTLLNASEKNIKSKTASSIDFISSNFTDYTDVQDNFDALINEQVANFSTWTTEASVGVAGMIEEVGGTTRYVNDKGAEVNQIFAKSLIGGLVVDQIVNNYLSINLLDTSTNVQDNNNDVLVAGENYTTMEHKWDEAYGYLFGIETDPTTFSYDVEDELLNKYLKKVDGDEDFAGTTQKIYDAFKLGRAAIVAKNYTIRDAQIDIIVQAISEAMAIRSVYYLQQGRTKLSIDKAAAFHDLSEGLGFIYSLMFTRLSGSVEGSYFSKEEVESYVAQLIGTEDGLWTDEDTLIVTLDAISNEIAGKFDFTVAEAKN